MKIIYNTISWFMFSFTASFVITIFMPFFGHAIVGMAFGGWSCLRVPPSLFITFVALVGCLTGSIFGGLIFIEPTLAVLFAISNLVGFILMYLYALKLPTRVAFPR